MANPSGEYGRYLLLAALFCGLYFASLLVYRWFVHPLARFPGPKLAAVSYWYEFYFDIIKKPGGQYFLKLEELHAKYGSIVRINPDEIQIHDAAFFDQIYAATASKTKRNRYPRSTTANSAPDSISSTVPHDLHRLRRSAMNPFFSKAAITSLEPRIHSQIELLCDQLTKYAETGEVLEIDHAYLALTLDVITDYCFGRSWACLRKPNFYPEMQRAMVDIASGSQMRKHMPPMTKILEALPDWIVERINPSLLPVFELIRQVEGLVAETVSGSSEKEAVAGDRTIFADILYSSLPPEEKTVERLSNDGSVLVFAGAETTARALSALTFHLLENPDILSRLRTELTKVMSVPASSVKLRDLEALEYLTAVIKEGLRIAATFTNRSLLYSPDEPIIYKEWTIPPRTPVCMNINRILHDATIFPDPESFRPDRWLGPAASRRAMEKAFVPFSKGARVCLGMNLAWAELYLCLAYVCHNFDMKLVGTDRARDVDVVRDCFIGLPSMQSKGVRVELSKRA